MALEFVDSIAWDQLEHAYGPATDVPALLERIANAKGRKHLNELGELWSRVLHQGSIYSASAPSARALIEMLEAPEAAKRDYRVAIDVSDWTIDHPATDALRRAYNEKGN